MGLPHVTDCLPWFGPDLDPIYRERGKHVHHAFHLLDTTGLDWSTVHPPWVGYVRAWEQCKKDAGIEIEGSEIYVKAADYCGRLDKVIRIGRKRYVLDLKTGIPTPMAGPQIAAYATAYGVKGRAVCQLNKDGTYIFTTEDTAGQKYFGPNDFRVFLAYLAIYQFEIAHGLRQPKERDDENES